MASLSQDSAIPEAILALLPNDPFEQLDIASKIHALALSKRVSALEQENNGWKTTAAERETKIKSLEEEVAQLRTSLADTSEKLSTALDEQAKLVGERNTLSMTVKKLNRDVAKLDMFRRTLMQSLQDEDGGDGVAESKQQNAMNAAVHGRSMSMVEHVNDSDSDTSLHQQPTRPSAVTSSFTPMVPSKPADEFTATPAPAYPKPSFTSVHADDHSATPAPSYPKPGPGMGVSARSHSFGGMGSVDPNSALAPLATPAATPMRRDDLNVVEIDSRATPKPLNIPLRTPSMTPHLTPAATPTGSPRRMSLAGDARTPRIDGKEFFRHARNRLSFEQFSLFLSNIKELNAHKQSREETLRRAEEIFGTDNKDLYAAFESLLSRHLPAS